jgi:hypothetical protein
MAREGVPLIVIQGQLGHTNLGITSIYLQGIDNTEIIDTVGRAARRWSPSTQRSGFEQPHRAPTPGGIARGTPPVMTEARHGPRRSMPWQPAVRSPRHDFSSCFPLPATFASRAPSTRAPRRTGR